MECKVGVFLKACFGRACYMKGRVHSEGYRGPCPGVLGRVQCWCGVQR